LNDNVYDINKKKKSKQIVKSPEKAREEFLQQLDKKRELASIPGANVLEIFDADDIDEMIYQSEHFIGKEVNFTKIQQFIKMLEQVHWLQSNTDFITGIKIDTPVKNRNYASISIDIRQHTYLNYQSCEVFQNILQLADNISILPMLVDDVIKARFVLNVSNTWM